MPTAIPKEEVVCPMARLVIWIPPNTRITRENRQAVSSAKIARAFFAPGPTRSTTMGIFIWPRSPATRDDPRRAIQANK